MSSSPITHYTTLGIPNDASQAAIRKAYLKNSLKYHPDKNPSDPEGAKAKFIEIGQAYEILSDPTHRASYDAELRRGNRKPASSFHQNNASSSSQQQTTNSTSSSQHSQQQQHSYQFNSTQEQTYESYRQAFDVNMANLSPAELEMMKGAATVLGSLVGSLAAKQFAGGRGGGIARDLLATAGGLAGSIAAQNVVQNMHEESVDRLEYEEARRRAVERGQEIPVRQSRRGGGSSSSSGGGGGGLGDWNDRVGGIFSKDEKGKTNVDWKQAASTASDLFGAVSNMVKDANSGGRR